MLFGILNQSFLTCKKHFIKTNKRTPSKWERSPQKIFLRLINVALRLLGTLEYLHYVFWHSNKMQIKFWNNSSANSLTQMSARNYLGKKMHQFLKNKCVTWSTLGLWVTHCTLQSGLFSIEPGSKFFFYF